MATDQKRAEILWRARENGDGTIDAVIEIAYAEGVASVTAALRRLAGVDGDASTMVAAIEGRLEAAEGLRARLTEHYLAEIVCDHDRALDNPICACSRVHLGWHPSVGAAVAAWIDHALAAYAPAAADEVGPVVRERDLCWKPVIAEDGYAENCGLWEHHAGPCLLVCGDCREGRCHIPIRPPAPGVGDPDCGCSRHLSSIAAWRLGEHDQGTTPAAGGLRPTTVDHLRDNGVNVGAQTHDPASAGYGTPEEAL